jgi:hypothetical protein
MARARWAADPATEARVNNRGRSVDAAELRARIETIVAAALTSHEIRPYRDDKVIHDAVHGSSVVDEYEIPAMVHEAFRDGREDAEARIREVGPHAIKPRRVFSPNLTSVGRCPHAQNAARPNDAGRARRAPTSLSQ